MNISAGWPSSTWGWREQGEEDGRHLHLGRWFPQGWGSFGFDFVSTWSHESYEFEQIGGLLSLRINFQSAFLVQVDQGTLFELILAANYLDIKVDHTNYLDIKVDHTSCIHSRSTRASCFCHGYTSIIPRRTCIEQAVFTGPAPKISAGKHMLEFRIYSPAEILGAGPLKTLIYHQGLLDVTCKTVANMIKGKFISQLN